MYKEILNDIKIALNNGGKTIEISKEADLTHERVAEENREYLAESLWRMSGMV